MDWSQVLMGAIGGGLGKTALDFLIEGRKQQAGEQRTIRAEEREEARKQAEQQRAEAEQLEAHKGTLLLYKTQLKGCADIHSAASVVGGIHSFFIQHKQYLAITSNTDFLLKYPGDFREQVIFNAVNSKKQFNIDDLKRDVERLSVEKV